MVVDPGHGGDDHGAVGATGVEEKTLVLGVARNAELPGHTDASALRTTGTDAGVVRTLARTLSRNRERNPDSSPSNYPDASRKACGMATSCIAIPARYQ